jgi:hypothetical protein
MGPDSLSPEWLLLLAQLPSSPSTARVALWRRLRAIGATGMVTSALWLPKIQARDFVPDERSSRAEEMLRQCRDALSSFSREVYAAAGVQEPAGTDQEGAESASEPGHEG